MTLLVAARWALLRSLNTRLWDAPAGEKDAVVPVGGCDRILRQTDPLIPTLFAQSGRDGQACMAASEPTPKGIAWPNHKNHNCAADPSCSTHAWTGGAQRVLDLTLHHHRAAFNATFILPEPIRSHRAF